MRYRTRNGMSQRPRPTVSARFSVEMMPMYAMATAYYSDGWRSAKPSYPRAVPVR